MADASRIDAEQSAIAVVHCGDMRQVLASMRCESVDAIVTDPPYGLSFMSKQWDQQVPGPEYWREALRVAKPGAHLIAFGGTRTAHRLACAIEDAGWEIRDCLSWLYGSGFPKSHDVSKAIDRELGAEREVVGLRSVSRDLSRNGRTGDEAISPVPVQSTQIPVTAPSTDAARAWSGWGTALKPAWEPIYLARRPFKCSVASNVVEHGCGGLNIDGCRIGTGKEVPHSVGTRGLAELDCGWGLRAAGDVSGRNPEIGRWPANLVLDEIAAAMLDAQTGTTQSSDRPRHNAADREPTSCGKGASVSSGYTDSGGASRFFYTAKAPRAEREAGLERFQARNVNDGRDTSIDNPYQRGDTQRRNTHPTVKPVSLMRWLVRLVTPLGGVVLDPFTGSGTTGVAAVLEGARFIGVELSPEFAALARARIAHAADEDDGDQLTLFDRSELKPAAPIRRQLSMFDLGEE